MVVRVDVDLGQSVKYRAFYLTWTFLSRTFPSRLSKAECPHREPSLTYLFVAGRIVHNQCSPQGNLTGRIIAHFVLAPSEPLTERRGSKKEMERRRRLSGGDSFCFSWRASSVWLLTRIGPVRSGVVDSGATEGEEP